MGSLNLNKAVLTTIGDSVEGTGPNPSVTRNCVRNTFELLLFTPPNDCRLNILENRLQSYNIYRSLKEGSTDNNDLKWK